MASTFCRTAASIRTNCRLSVIQIIVDEICELEKSISKVKVCIWFWDNITERLAAYPELIVKYYPDFYANLTALPLVERLVDTPVQVVSVHHSCQHGALLEQRLRFRGVRIRTLNGPALIHAGPNLGTTLPDGVLLCFDPSSVNDPDLSISMFAGKVLGYSQQLESGCPVFVLIQPSFTAVFQESYLSCGGESHRIQLLDPNLSYGVQADIVFNHIFDYAFWRRGGPATINIAIRTSQGRPGAVLLDLDWQGRLDTSIFPTQAEWSKEFVTALHTVRNHVLRQSDRTRIQFNCQLPLPAAFAVGFYFNVRIARVGVWSRNTAVSDFKQQLWLSDGHAADIKLEPRWIRPPGVDSRSAIVELTSHVSIGRAIEVFLEESGLTVDAWLKLDFGLDGQSAKNITEGYAVAYANQVGANIRRLNEQGITDIYLFARIPSALALLIGQRLQACGRIHLYWFANPTYRYAFTLD